MAKEEFCRLAKELYLAEKKSGRVPKEFGQAGKESCRLAKELESAKLLGGRLRKEFGQAELLFYRLQLLSYRAKLLGNQAGLVPYRVAQVCCVIPKKASDFCFGQPEVMQVTEAGGTDFAFVVLG